MKTFNIKDIPTDVMWVWTVASFVKQIGIGTHNEIQAIIKKYPEYFPWETKYAKIPDKIHRAYEKEWNELNQYRFDNSYDGKLWNKAMDGSKGKGIMAMIEEYDKVMRENAIKIEVKPFTLEMFKNTLKSIEENDDRRRKEMIKIEEENEQLWNKHYKKYGLTYRQN